MSFPVSVSMCSHLEGFCVQRHAWLRGLSVRGVFAHSAAMIGKIPKSSQMKFSSQSLRGKKNPNYIDNCSVPFSNQSWFLAQRKKRVWRKSVEVSMKWHVGHIKILGWIDTLMFYLRHGDGSGWRKKKRLNRMREDKRKQISDAMTPSHPAGFPEGEEASNERGDEDEGEELINLKLRPPRSNPWWH